MKYQKKKNKSHANSVLQQRGELSFNRTAKQANGSGLREDDRLDEDSRERDSAYGGKDHRRVKGGRSPAKGRRTSSG